MEAEFATTSDRLLRRWLHYIDSFEALFKASMCRPRLQGKFQANSCPVSVLALHVIGSFQLKLGNVVNGCPDLEQ
jgi:hypothetical protein